MMNLSSLVRSHALRTPDKIAIVYGDQRLSYRDLAKRVTVIAAGLAAAGIQPGDVVALLMKNSSGFIEIALAVSDAGAVLLPINFRLSAEEVGYIAGNAKAHVLIADEEFTAAAPECVRLLTLDAAAQADPGRLFDPSLASDWVPITRRAEDLFRLMYTSGTTDRPKGVIHSYANFYWKTADQIAVLGITGATRLLIVGPLYHVGAFDLPGLGVLWAGGTIVILRDFDPLAVLGTIERERIDAAWLAPVMTTAILALTAADKGRHDVSSLRWVIGGGERTPENRIRAFNGLFTQARYVDAFGMTETCGGDTFMVPGREIDKIGSTGLPLPLLEVSIRDEAGEALATGCEGEICLRGPKVTAGYWMDPAKTAAAFFGDWFRSGDIGYLDADGYLFLTDRKKDMIISGGENIASSEVERVILAIPEVLETAVIGLPDVRWGEMPVAIVVRVAGAMLEESDVVSRCRDQLAGFKVPRRVIFVDRLPRNPSGKILKRILRERLLESSAG